MTSMWWRQVSFQMEMHESHLCKIGDYCDFESLRCLHRGVYLAARLKKWRHRACLEEPRVSLAVANPTPI